MDWPATAQKSIYEVSVILDRATIALDTYVKKENLKINMVRLAQSSSKLAGVFGVVGAIFSIVLAFIPASESPEITLMKSEFNKMSEKIDNIAKSLDDTKNLIKSRTQQLAYKAHEDKIHTGQSQLKICIGKLNNVTCSGLKECKRKKVLIAEGYAKSMNVIENVEAIWRGVTSDTIFGDSLLELLKEESECNVPKLNLFVNKVTALLMKGLTVSTFYDLLTKVDYNVLGNTVLAGKILQSLESRRQDIQHRCFDDINYWMPLDVKNLHEHFNSDAKATNIKLLKTLKIKYPWIWWHVFTYKGKVEPQTGPKDSTFQLLFSSSKVKEMHSYVIPTNIAKVQNFYKKADQWKRIAAAIRSDTKAEYIDNRVKVDLILKNQIQSFAILPGEKVFLSHYEQEIRDHELGAGSTDIRTSNILVNRPRRDVLVVGSFVQSNYPPTCSKTCNGNGKCYVYPYSTKTGCRCSNGYGGENCKSLDTSLKLKSVINSMVQKTMKLPTFATIQHSIQDTQLYLKTSTENILTSITKLGERIDEQFKSLGDFMSNKFEWFATLSKYKEAIENLNYFHSISTKKISHFQQNDSFTNFNITAHKTQFLMEKDKEIAKFLLSPAGIRKWLYQINFLIVGRRDSQFNAHKALIFMVMDKYQDRVCSQTYRNEITRTYRQLMLLQLQGYMLWSNAYSIVNRDSSIISDSYNEVLASQQTYLKGATCPVKIAHSKNMHDCTDGYFIHRTLKVDVQATCNDGYFMKGKQKLIRFNVWCC